MEIFEGKSIYEDIAIGRIWHYQKKELPVTKQHREDCTAEMLRFDRARQTADAQLRSLHERALQRVGEADAQIFEMHMLMLQDEEYLSSVYRIIREEQVNAEFAVAATRDSFCDLFETMEDAYLQERAADIRDVSYRVLSILSGSTQGTVIDEPVILMADDLTPSETIQMDRSKLLALVTRCGGPNSHTAILARTMGIPALTGIAIRNEWNGKTAIVNGHAGELIIDPDETSIRQAKQKMEETSVRNTQLQQMKGKETITRSGRKIDLFANIGDLSDTAAALSNDAEGIGLLRSEFLYLESRNYPTEEQLFTAYKAIVEKMGDKKVIIRTLDIGADKQPDYFHLEQEANPAMGMRAIRFCLTHPDVFMTQLRAILRAGMYGNISVMFPMITGVEEIRAGKALVRQAKEELRQQGIVCRDIEIGAMIETPAAVMISDLLAGEVDFFSIGTNDLTQYALAVDRQNPHLHAFYNPRHEAVLRMIELAVQNGHRKKCRVGICGELAADTLLTERFIRMGVDALSVAPSYILGLREQIRTMDC